MKKRYAMRFGSYLLSTALLTVSLAGCGSTETTEAESPILPEETSEAESVVTEALTAQLGNGSADSSGTQAKEETVYVFTNASGEQTSVLVNEKLKNISDTDVIEDLTTLTDIENLTGDETYTTGDGNAITWSYAGNDITYRGTTDAQTPVSIQVTYYLNDKEISPEDLAGQSGNVRIRFDYTNNEKRTIEVNGKTKDAYVPFTVMTGMLMDSEHFSNIEVTNGSVSETGSGNLVVGVAMPGLTESLDLDSYRDEDDEEEIDLDISEYFEVTATATEFELDMMMSVVSSGLMTDVDVDDLTLDDLTDSLDELKDATVELIDGTQELKDGTQELADNMPDLDEGVTKLDDGAEDLQEGAQQLIEGAGTLENGLGTLAGKVDEQIVPGVAQLTAGAQNLNNGANELVSTITGSKEQIVSGLKNNDKLTNALNGKTLVMGTASSDSEISIDAVISNLTTALNSASDNTERETIAGTISELSYYKGQYAALATIQTKLEEAGLQSGVSQLAAGMQTLQAGIGSFDESAIEAATADGGTATICSGIYQLQEGASKLTDGAKTLREGTDTLKDGTAELKSSTVDLIDGVNKLNDGAGELRDGVKEYDEDGIQKLTDLVDEDATDLLDTFKAIIRLGQDYQSFAGKPDTLDGSVVFIYRMDGISKE